MLQWLKISDPVGLFIEVACEMTWVLGLLLYPVDNVWIRMMFGLSIALGDIPGQCVGESCEASRKGRQQRGYKSVPWTLSSCALAAVRLNLH